MGDRLRLFVWCVARRSYKSGRQVGTAEVTVLPVTCCRNSSTAVSRSSHIVEFKAVCSPKYRRGAERQAADGLLACLEKICELIRWQFLDTAMKLWERWAT